MCDYIYFPVTKTGYWHNGIHRYRKVSNVQVISLFFGEILLKSKEPPAVMYPSVWPERVLKNELEFKSIEEYEKYENLSVINLSELSKDEREKVMEAIGLSSFPTYVLQKHSINFENQSFSYYSFIRHLATLNEFKKIDDTEYIFPCEGIGNYGNSEGEADMIQQEYFICSDSSYFKDCVPKIFDYYKIEKNQKFNLYRGEQQNCTPIYVDKKTEFNVLNENSDYENYPHSLKLKIKRYHVEIDSEYLADNNLSVKTIGNNISILDRNDVEIDEVNIKILNPLSNEREKKLVKVKYLQIKENNYKDNLYLVHDIFDIQPFWSEADERKLKQWRKYIFIIKDSVLNSYKHAPDKKKFIRLEDEYTASEFKFYSAQINSLILYESVDGKKFLKLKDCEKDIYISYEELKDRFNFWNDFKNATTILYKNDLKSYNASEGNCKHLQEILKDINIIDSVDSNLDFTDFLIKYKDKLKMTGFQHISEWSQVKLNPLKIDHPEETADLWKKLYIWKKNGKSSLLPKEISDSNRFIYFHPDYFENWLFDLHRCFAERLASVQNLIMEDWRMKQGNCGVYYESTGFAGTFCNHAVYETIKQVDKNYLSFLLNIDEPPWNLEKYKNKDFISLLKKNGSLNKENYIYKESNLWCDILEFQSQKIKEAGICKITAEQAFYMAQLGYVVIACWKNLTLKGTDSNVNYSPHYVTVRPSDYSVKYSTENDIKVAHVGVSDNEERSLKEAFRGKGNEKNKKKYNELLFYCNVKQKFI